MIERTTTRIAHLERTSEADRVPLRWAYAELKRAHDLLPADAQAEAVYCGWRDGRIEYPHRLTDVEYERANKEHLARVMQQALADGIVTVDEMAAMSAAAAAAIAP